MARNTYGLIGRNNGRSAYRLLADNTLKTDIGGLSLDVMPNAEPIDPVKAAMNAVASRVASNQPGNISRGSSSSESSSIAGPASTEDIVRLLDIAGIKNDGSKVDINQFKSKAIPEYEGLQQLIASRPTEVSLRGLDQIANALSSTDRKVKFDQPDYTADDKLKQYTDIGAAIQKQRDDEMKRQEDIFKAISGVTSVRSSGKTSSSEQGSAGIPNPPKTTGGGAPKPKKLTAAQQKELEGYRDAMSEIQETNKLLTDKDYVGPADALKPTMFLSGGHAAFRQQLGLLQDPYRSRVTGQAAADKELERIAGRLPKESDTYEQFKAKSANYERNMTDAFNRRMQAYRDQGIDVSMFENGAKSAGNDGNSDAMRSAAKALLEKRKAAKK